MELLTNELSVDQYVFSSEEKIRHLSDVYKGLKKNGINTCRINSSDYDMVIKSLSNDSISNATKRNVESFLYSFLKTPFEGTDEIESKEDAYYGKMPVKRVTDCTGKHVVGKEKERWEER